MSFKPTGRSKGWGIVEYETPEEVSADMQLQCLLQNGGAGGQSIAKGLEGRWQMAANAVHPHRQAEPQMEPRSSDGPVACHLGKMASDARCGANCSSHQQGQPLFLCPEGLARFCSPCQLAFKTL